MKYYSEKTQKLYDSVDELNKAEFKAKEAENLAKIKAEKEKAEKEKVAAERKSRAAEVEEARKNMVTAQEKYRELLEAFIHDYHTYHFSTSDVKDFPTLFDFFNLF